MKGLAVLTALIGIAFAQESASAAFESLPACGQKCLLPVLISQQCNLTSLATVGDCICEDVPALRNISDCVQAHCDTVDLYSVSETNAQLCLAFPVKSQSQNLRTVIYCLSSVGIALVLLRFLSRGLTTGHFSSFGFGWDDGVVLICLLELIAVECVLIIAADKGFGKHLWDVDVVQLPEILKLFYIVQLLYVTSQCSTKIAVLGLYLRIFPQKWLRNCIYVVSVIVVLHWLIYLFLLAFQCTPVSAVWHIGSPVKCVNKLLIAYTGAGFAIVEDVVIIALPIPCISSLNLSRAKKLGVCFLFALGSFSMVTSCIRVKFIPGYGSMTDPTWDNFDIVVWSCVEIFSALICACLPTLRPLFRAIWRPLQSPQSTETYQSTDVPSQQSFTRDMKLFSENSDAESRGVTPHDGQELTEYRRQSFLPGISTSLSSIKGRLSGVQSKWGASLDSNTHLRTSSPTAFLPKTSNNRRHTGTHKSITRSSIPISKFAAPLSPSTIELQPPQSRATDSDLESGSSFNYANSHV